MKIIPASFKFETPLTEFTAANALGLIEAATRTCYKSECKEGTTRQFIRNIAQVKKHRSVIEHVSFTVRFIVDRGVSHELVRHRLAAFSQESTRYCNYSKDKFGKEITVIKPCFWTEDSTPYHEWVIACRYAEKFYFELLDLGCSPQQARSVLPNSLKTEVVMTCNLREWHHVFSLRTPESAHPQMREVMIPLCAEFQKYLPEIFDDIKL